MRNFTHFEAPLGVCRVYFCDKSQKYSILRAKPHKLLDGEYKSRVNESRNLPHGKEAFGVPKTGATMNGAMDL
jgi:hypothetical protein